MPKNKGKGGKYFRKIKKLGEVDIKNIILKDEGQEYAIVTKMLGNSRILAMTPDKEIMCIIRGSMKKKVWIVVGDIILISIRDFQNDKADVIMKYTPEQARFLRSVGEIGEFEKTIEQSNDGFDFGLAEDDAEFNIDEI